MNTLEKWRNSIKNGFDFCDGFFRKNAKTVGTVSFLVPPLLVFLLFFIVAKSGNLYPFGANAMSWCDMNQQVIPLMCELKDVLTGKSDWFMSYQNAGGMNFFAVFMFNLSSPFSLLVAFVDKNDMSLFMNVLILLKMMTASVTAYVYLRKKFDSPCSVIAITLSVLYAFSGYTMLYYQIITWLDCVYMFPLLLLSLEKLMDGESPVLYTLVLSIEILINFYIGYMEVVYIILFVGVSFLVGKKDKKCLYNFVIGSFFAAMITAVVYIPVLFEYVRSARSGSVIDGIKYSNFLPHLQTTLPTFLCTALFLPFLVFKTDDKNVTTLRIMLILTLVPAFIEPINKMWQTGSYMSFPTRYGFMTIFTCFAVVAEFFKNAEKGDTEKNFILEILATVLSIVLVISFVKFSVEYVTENIETLSYFTRSLWGNDDSLHGLLIWFAVELALGITLFVLNKLGYLKKFILCLLTLSVVVSSCVLNGKIYMVSPSHSADDYREVMSAANLIDDESGFYRVKTDYKMFSYGDSIGVNAVGAMGYNTLAHYTSMNPEDYMKVVKQLGYSSYWMETGDYGGTAFSDAFLVNKYKICRGNRLGAKYFDGTWCAVEQPVLNLGVLVHGKPVATLEGERSTATEILFENVTGKTGLIEKIDLSSAYLCGTEIGYENGVYKIGKSADTSIIEAKVEINGTKTLYFECFDLYTNALTQHINDSFMIHANGVVVGSYPSQSSNGFINLGTYTNSSVTVRIDVLKDFYGESFGLFTEDKAVLSNALDTVKTANLSTVKNKISGSVTAEDGDYLVIAVPYDKGFSARVNGKKVEVEKVLTDFIAIKLESGQNDVKLRFIPQGLCLGIVIYLFGIALFAIYLTFERKIFEKLQDKSKNILYNITCLGVIGLFAVVVLLVYIAPTLLCLIY